jgi:hypothetical protein
MEPEGSLLHSQHPTSDPCPEPEGITWLLLFVKSASWASVRNLHFQVMELIDWAEFGAPRVFILLLADSWGIAVLKVCVGGIIAYVWEIQTHLSLHNCRVIHFHERLRARV